MMIWLFLALAGYWAYRKITESTDAPPTSPHSNDDQETSSPSTHCGGLREEADVYRSKSGLLQVGFRFVPINGAYRIYIATPINYGGRPDGGALTHRLEDGRGKYVCWTGILRSIADAKQVASAWTEATDTYIQTGRQFGQQSPT